MSKDWLIILGSGFSRAVNKAMPTLGDLDNEIRKELTADDHWKDKPYLENLDNFELLLSYLGSEQPWKTPPENYKDKALFEIIKSLLSKTISEKEGKAFEDEIPIWFFEFAQLLHQEKIPVISFNYDTVLERIVYILGGRKNWPSTSDLYELPVTHLKHREAMAWGAQEVETFKLIKLHGSINWFYSGEDEFPGEQVYFRKVDSLSPQTDLIDDTPKSKEKMARLLKDKYPLIIPPVMEKSEFYTNKMVKTLWQDARQALSEAERILAIGYSFPPTDLTTRMLVNSNSGFPKRVFITDNDEERKKELTSNYEMVFPSETEIDTEFIRENNPVDAAVEHLFDSVSSSADRKASFRQKLKKHLEERNFWD